MTDILPYDYIVSEFSKAMTYFLKRRLFPTAVKRSADGEFAVVFTESRNEQ